MLPLPQTNICTNNYTSIILQFNNDFYFFIDFNFVTYSIILSIIR